PWIALSALPVHRDSHGHFVTKLGQSPGPHGGGGFKNDPVLGLVENLGLHGQLLHSAKIYVGVLAATILFIATNAGVIGASRITYSMSSYRQLPEVFRRLHPRFKTPWLALVVFAGLTPIVFLLPGPRLARGRLRVLRPVPEAVRPRAARRNGAGAASGRPRDRARVPQHPRPGLGRARVRGGGRPRVPARRRARRVDRRGQRDRGAARATARRAASRGGGAGQRPPRRGACDRRLV